MAIEPISWPALSEWRQVLVRTWKEARDDNIGLLAAGVAFYGFLAFVPLLASAVLTYGLVADPQTVAEHIRTLARTLPREAAAIVADQLQAITGDKSSAHGIGLLLAIAVALYGASKGSASVVTALNTAYEVKESRGFIKRTLLALLMTTGLMVVVLLGASAISALAFIEHLLPFSSPVVHTALQLLLWAVAAAVVGLGFAFIYRYAPDRPDAPWAWITPGSAAATLLWLVATLGFGLYVSNFGDYNATYGSLGGVVVFLTWLYLGAYIVLMGGEMNSELERQQAKEAGLPARPTATAGPVAAEAAPGRVNWPLAAVGFVLSRRG
ncbi:MAG TPA: YihY/virulence factor BrkB family protein [Allosphingosinicella sp.]|nr:YihY/virulence factor BrkB family protein [Allosphingosinicella sp.]